MGISRLKIQAAKGKQVISHEVECRKAKEVEESKNLHEFYYHEVLSKPTDRQTATVMLSIGVVV